eukprot:4622755-Heterocapsa_arctica.AAC.1
MGCEAGLPRVNPRYRALPPLPPRRGTWLGRPASALALPAPRRGARARMSTGMTLPALTAATTS